MPPTKKTDSQIKKDKQQQFMKLIAKKASYYRSNPHRWAQEYLGVRLKLFQKILMWAFNEYNFSLYCAARGQGKSWLTALYCCFRAICYPNSKIVVCSYTRKQGNEVLLKIQDDFMKNYPILATEIERCNIGQNDAAIYFKNHSWIRVVTASDSGRGARANLLIVDESRMVERSIMQTVLRKFLTAPRHPKFMDKPEYKNYPAERNKEIYMTSCFFQDSELFEQAQAYTAAFLDDTKKYWIVGLPYQVSVKEGLLSREQVLDEVSESTFSDISWMMEMECLFYGCGDDALFSYSTLMSRRRLNESFYPLEEYRQNNIKVPDLVKGEERILSVDVALMASRRHANDASALTILSCLPTDSGDFVCNVPYLETKEGLTVDDLGLLVMRFFYQYKCTQLCVDGSGVGQAIVDFCLTDRYDPMYNQTYPAISCCNNPDIEARCKVRNAQKALWVIKANANTNNDMYLALRSAFMNGNINLLIAENTAEDFIRKHIKGFNKMSAQQQAMYRVPYLQTSLLIEELAKLEHENKNGNIKVKERAGMRKDRVSSLLYGYYICQQLSYKKKRVTNTADLVSRLPIRQGKRFSMFN